LKHIESLFCIEIEIGIEIGIEPAGIIDFYDFDFDSDFDGADLCRQRFPWVNDIDFSMPR
jgi:histidinol phosphatase-like PHP family hydrolase